MALVIAYTLSSGPLAFGLAEALKFALFVLTTIGLSNCGPLVHKDFTEAELGWYNEDLGITKNEFIKVLSDGFKTNIGSTSYERKLVAPGNPYFMTKDNNYSDCGVIMLYPYDSVHALTDYSFASFNKKQPPTIDGNQFVDFTWPPGDWSRILYLNTFFDTDLDESDKHPLIEKIATVTDDGITDDGSLWYEFTSKLTKSDRDRVEDERTTVYPDSVPHPRLHAYLVKTGESKVNFAVTSWTAIPEKWTRNLIPYTITVTEENDPHITPGPDSTLQTFFPTGTILSPEFEQMLINNATAKDDCTDQKDLIITTNLLDLLDKKTGHLGIGPNNVTLTTQDFSGNIGTATVIVTVEDTIPPDIHPVENVGVMLKDNVYSISGNDLFGGNYPNDGDEPLLEEPITFDLGTLNPLSSCYITQNPDNSCKEFDFPVGKTTINWEIADLKDNISKTTQEVHVRNIVNNPSKAIPDSIKVAKGTTTEIKIHGEDADHDALKFILKKNPSLGKLSAGVDATFQNRYSIAGTITDMSHFESQTRKSQFNQLYDFYMTTFFNDRQVLEIEPTDKSILRLYSRDLDVNVKWLRGFADLSNFNVIIDELKEEKIVICCSGMSYLTFNITDRSTATPIKMKSGGSIDTGQDGNFNYELKKPDEQITFIPQPDKKRILVLGSVDGLLDIIDLSSYDIQPSEIIGDIPNREYHTRIGRNLDHFWDKSRDKDYDEWKKYQYDTNAFTIVDWNADKIYFIKYSLKEGTKGTFTIDNDAIDLSRFDFKDPQDFDTGSGFDESSTGDRYDYYMYVLDNDNGKFVLWQLTCLKYVCDPDISKKINPKGFAGWDPRSTKISTAQMIDTSDALMMYHWDEKKLWVMLAKIMSEGNDGLKLYEVDRWDLTAMRNAKINPLYEPNGFVYKGETSDHYLIEIGDSKTANTKLIKLLMSSKYTVKSLPNEVGADFVKISAIDADIDGFFYLGDKTGLSKFNVRGDLENHSINKNQVVDVVVAKDSIFSIEKNYNFGKIQGKLELNRWNYYIMQYDKNLNLGATYPIGYDRSILYGGQPFGQDWSYVSRLAYDPVTERLAYLTVEGIYLLDPNSELVAGENPVRIAEQIPLNQYT
ncbi:MAG: hypothetical protein IH948_02165, partial [Bacteroidetes bacterium]|nr:hypothetical protein [Bacteroidota bacterium]